jgi:hypothetical protein
MGSRRHDLPAERAFHHPQASTGSVSAIGYRTRANAACSLLLFAAVLLLLLLCCF